MARSIELESKIEKHKFLESLYIPKKKSRIIEGVEGYHGVLKNGRITYYLLLPLSTTTPLTYYYPYSSPYLLLLPLPTTTPTPPLTYYYPYSSPYLLLPLLLPLPTTTPTPPLTYYYPYSSPYLLLPLLLPLPTTTPTPPLTYYYPYSTTTTPTPPLTYYYPYSSPYLLFPGAWSEVTSIVTYVMMTNSLIQSMKHIYMDAVCKLS